MCGILGSFSYGDARSREAFHEVFRGALDLVRHRGPDGEGLWSRAGSGPQVQFGHRRLSIIDLSTAASQPMELDGLCIIFNGEIYNYRELRDELAKSGAAFSTSSDTEVILRAYQKWGTRCFERFNGMWAIALWDESKKELVLSRDRLGVKPLYYAEAGGALFFGSEIKQLLHVRKKFGTRPEWNLTRLYEFLSEGRQHHAEDTLYDGVYQLRPAHVAVLGREASVSAVRSSAKAYWDFPSEDDVRAYASTSFNDAALELRSLLESAVSFRLRSDVPVGSALSGGLDSSGIVSYIARLNPMKQKTFSATFKGSPVDERRYAEMVIKGTPIEGVFVEPTPDGLREALPKLIAHQDGPFASTSMYAQWEVFKTARANGVPVTLDGQGADELFAGYEGFLKSHLSAVLKAGRPVRALTEGVQFVLNHPSYYGSRERWLKKTRPAADPLAFFAPEARAELEHGLRAPSRYELVFGSSERRYADPLREHLYRATTSTSLPALLMYEDRNSMAFSVESRTPFLDYRVVELAFKCPTAFHIRGGMRKALLREALRGIIPEAIRVRKDKIGFATPENEWKKTHFGGLGRVAVNELDSSVFDQARFKDALEAPAPSWRVISVALAQSAFLDKV